MAGIGTYTAAGGWRQGGVREGCWTSTGENVGLGEDQVGRER